MTDEKHVYLNGFVNKQNFRYWEVENPRILNENKLHPQRANVRCVIMCDCIISPYFFENTLKALQRQSIEKEINTCSIHSLDLLLFIRAIVTNCGFNRMEQLATQPMKPWMCCRECLAITSSIAELLSPGNQDQRTEMLKTTIFGDI